MSVQTSNITKGTMTFPSSQDPSISTATLQSQARALAQHYFSSNPGSDDDPKNHFSHSTLRRLLTEDNLDRETIQISLDILEYRMTKMSNAEHLLRDAGIPILKLKGRELSGDDFDFDAFIREARADGELLTRYLRMNLLVCHSRKILQRAFFVWNDWLKPEWYIAASLAAARDLTIKTLEEKVEEMMHKNMPGVDNLIAGSGTFWDVYADSLCSPEKRSAFEAAALGLDKGSSLFGGKLGDLHGDCISVDVTDS